MSIHRAEEPRDAQPPLVIDAAHFDRLQDLALGTLEKLPEVAGRLLEEVERADVRASDEMPADVVTIGSTVTYRDEETGRSRSVRLVYPADADINAGRVSVLTPIGAALIGLREGHRMLWETTGGEARHLTVVKVERP